MDVTCDALLGPVLDADAVAGGVEDLLLGGAAVEDPFLAALFAGGGKVSQAVPLTALLYVLRKCISNSTKEEKTKNKRGKGGEEKEKKGQRKKRGTNADS